MVEKQETNTFSKLANHVIFNSVTDNPYYGDERKFFRIRKLGEPFYSTNIHLIPGEEYEAEIFFHNNANPILNTKENIFYLHLQEMSHHCHHINPENAVQIFQEPIAYSNTHL